MPMAFTPISIVLGGRYKAARGMILRDIAKINYITTSFRKFSFKKLQLPVIIAPTEVETSQKKFFLFLA